MPWIRFSYKVKYLMVTPSSLLIMGLVWLCVGVLRPATAQTAALVPELLTRVPLKGVSDDRFWQQLRVTLAQEDDPSDSTISVRLPMGVKVADTNGDSEVRDEIRVTYAAAEVENPYFQVSELTTDVRIVLSSQNPAAVGGTIFLQYPILISADNSGETAAGFYGRIDFADPRSTDIRPGDGPRLIYVTVDEFEAFGSMNVVPLGGSLVGTNDTTTTALGTWYPDEPAPLFLNLPDLLFDNGSGSVASSLSPADHNDGNDVVYRFFLSIEGSLRQVTNTVAIPAQVAEDSNYVQHEREVSGALARLMIRDLPEDVYYLYVVSDLTGTIPLGRSRPLRVRHEPRFTSLSVAEAPITLDSGGFYDARGLVSGKGIHRTSIDFAVTDHDDTAQVHLFYSEVANLGMEHVQLSEGVIGALDSAEAIVAALPAINEAFVWDTTTPSVVDGGTYYIYGLVDDGKARDLRRSDVAVEVQHSPFLRIDPLDDRVRSGADTIRTGGWAPQRYLTPNWGRGGFDGDRDIDDDAVISLYYSSWPAVQPGTVCDSCFTMMTGAEKLLEQLGENVFPIVTGLREDPDQRSDNRYVWDLWQLADAGMARPPAGVVHYLYGIIADGRAHRLVQMHGRRLNDAGARLIFEHPPTLMPLQPAADVEVVPGRRIRFAWDDMDMDDDARIRVLLTDTDHGYLTDYGSVAGQSFVVNSREGHADAAVDIEMDLSEDSLVDHIDIALDHIEANVSGENAFGDGDYYAYLAITETDTFDAGASTWRCSGRVKITNFGKAPETVNTIGLFPEIISLGLGGVQQRFDLVVDVGGIAIDHVSVRLELPRQAFAVVDQDEQLQDIQPFRVADAYSRSLVFTNRVSDANEKWVLDFDYLDPSAKNIPGLDGRNVLASIELLSQNIAGLQSIETSLDEVGQGTTRLSRDNATIYAAPAVSLSEVNLFNARGELGGQLFLEGRQEHNAVVDFSLRSSGRDDPLLDERFFAANDLDFERPGVQVELASDGGFLLRQVPVGRFDLHVHLDGYLDFAAVGLELQPGQQLVDVRPVTNAAGESGVMRGGDVAGYTETDGRTTPDNEVTLADWDYLAVLFGRQLDSAADSVIADINNDGRIDIGDMALVGANYGAVGSRPVYKARNDIPRWPGIEAALERNNVGMGDTASFMVRLIQPACIRAFELELKYDPGDWQLVNITTGTDEILTARRSSHGRDRLAATLLDRGLDLDRTPYLVRWSLQSRSQYPRSPSISDAVFIDVAHHRLVSNMVVNNRPSGFDLEPNHPNPFNPETVIPFAVPTGVLKSRRVFLEIYNVLGQRVTTLLSGNLAPGRHRAVWNGRGSSGELVASGVYVYQLRVGELVRSRRMLLLR